MTSIQFLCNFASTTYGSPPRQKTQVWAGAISSIDGRNDPVPRPKRVHVFLPGDMPTDADAWPIMRISCTAGQFFPVTWVT